jgi:hypothetical protein
MLLFDVGLLLGMLLVRLPLLRLLLRCVLLRPPSGVAVLTAPCCWHDCATSRWLWMLRAARLPTCCQWHHC